MKANFAQMAHSFHSIWLMYAHFTSISAPCVSEQKDSVDFYGSLN